jgi:isoleucyl-tRNA synthetase
MDYKNTIFLPKTEFALKINPKKDQELLDFWKNTDLYGSLRKKKKGKKFILHSGPPFANSNIHCGHALNIILKDLTVRSREMLGYSAPFVPGWDCHGLPIEWKVEEEFKALGRRKDEVPVKEMRNRCREFAQHWIDIQREEFKSLGIMADWDNPYLTMDHSSEARIVKELGRFLLNGSLIKDYKPVMWSPVEKTALAEAEIEYKEIETTSGYFKFQIVGLTGAHPLYDASLVVWTTTPWTLPANRAVAYNSSLRYILLEVFDYNPNRTEKFVIAWDTFEKFTKSLDIKSYICSTIQPDDLKNLNVLNPLAAFATEPVPVVDAPYVQGDVGTGFVHVAPDHGLDDFQCGLKYGLSMLHLVQENGTYKKGTPLLAGMYALKSNLFIFELAKSNQTLLMTEVIKHKYPHSWRSKSPIIFRSTSQWFISMELNNLRNKALQEINQVSWLPENTKNRITAMVAGRPDWCISRQRVWGVPLPIFVHKETKEPLRNPKVMERVVAAVAAYGCDVWFDQPTEYFLGKDAVHYDKVTDILDVWFESGSSHAFVLQERPELNWPADLYLEGSDQHRGWFQSSLLESCATIGSAPYKKVLTHGFLLTDSKAKMSKSSGNALAPRPLVEKYGVDVLRLWVASSDYTNDIVINTELFDRQVDVLKKFRNTFRFLLGCLQGSAESAKQVVYTHLPELEQYMLHRLFTLSENVKKDYTELDFHKAYVRLYDFCTNDLSSFYFDIRKDSLYCDSVDDPRRQATIRVLYIIYNTLIRLLAPIIPFTAEEVWSHFKTDDVESVHLLEFVYLNRIMEKPALNDKWEKVKALRSLVLGGLEMMRAAKMIGSGLEADVYLTLDDNMSQVMDKVPLAELFIVSDVVSGVAENSPFTLRESGVTVTFALARGQKCSRCWQYTKTVGHHEEHSELCDRCVIAVRD